MKASYKNYFIEQTQKDADETRARKELLARGKSFPIKKSGQSDLDYYSELRDYGAQETLLILEYEQARKIPASSIAETSSLKPNQKKWEKSYYDK